MGREIARSSADDVAGFDARREVATSDDARRPKAEGDVATTFPMD